MVIKLVRTDTADAFKIELSVGEHLFGRGKLLGCEDKRISRNHGQLEVLDASLNISSLHQNPCFYIKNNSKDVQILKKDSTISLFNGDRFGLLPDTFWYEVIYSSGIDAEPVKETDESEKNTEEYTLEALNDNCNVENSNNANLNGLNTDINLTSTVVDNERCESPSLTSQTTSAEMLCENIKLEGNLLSDEDKQSSETDNEDLNKTCHKQLNPINNDNESNEEERNLNSDQKSPGKRCSSPEHFEAKKLKTEPVDVKTEPDDTKPGTSNVDQAQLPADGNKQNIPKIPTRERCMYGVNCYRKNPVHLSQFSHPRDNDWGGDAQAPCPYGAACAKRDPRHHRDHTHPPGYTPPPPNAPGVQIVHRHGNVYYINAHAVNFYDDHLQVLDSDGDSVDYDYEF